ncbi:hypothetical protein [uncultured Psychromonas sp.]|uniref:hypothetical protein n=1 Tax=uncultured Psychromonas sp. TaxID=173974 RepID=UPI002618FAF1|nr:hypothetical protein [uncultured Psychromonas sp.]
MKIIYLFTLLFFNAFNVMAKEVIMDHSHLPINVPDNIATPALSLHLVKDAMSGYNLTLQLQRYTLIPPPEGVSSMMELMKASINKKSGFVEGHAHLYVNGIKIQRIYGKHIHINQSLFKNGINTVSVTLNNHGHMYWVAHDKKVLSTLYVDKDKTPFITYKFESFPVK